MANYEVAEIIRKYWQVEADSVEQAYDLVMDGHREAVLVREDGECSYVVEVPEVTDYYKPGDMVNE
jgi:hypothetical protein